MTEHHDIGQVLEDFISDRRLQPGDRLPSERALAEQLSTSRATVRRGLARLEANRRLIRHVGRGTFLAEPGENSPEHISPTEILAVRRHLEPAIIPMVVANATAADLERIRHCLAQSEAATTFEDYELWDAALHAAIVESTHNRLLASLYQTINQTREFAVWGDLKRRTFSAAVRRGYEDQHRAIVDALVDRDADAARNAMDVHLRRITDMLLSA